MATGHPAWNRLSVAEHLQRGTYRADRHGKRTDEAPSAPLSAADKRRALQGLEPDARRIAGRVLDEFQDWHAAAIQTLRAYAVAAAQLDRLQADPTANPREVRAQIRSVVSLYRALDLP